MADLTNNSYQENVTKKEVAPLTEFLEAVQSRHGLSNQGKRDRFDPYTRIHSIKEHSLGDALNNIQMLREADEEEEDELDDIGDVDTDAEISDAETDPDTETDLDVEPNPETDVSDDDIDNEVDPEEGKIVDGEGEKIGNIFIGPGQRYFMGASTDPQMIIAGKVSPDYVWFYSFPFKKAEKIKKEIAADLFETGSNTWLKDPKSKNDDDLRTSIESVLNGRPDERVSIDDYQFSNIQVKYAGEVTGDLEPWKELEQEYDVVVDSNLTNKQTYNLRMNNKELESFRAELQEKPVSERNFKIIRIVTEERQYMIEATSNSMVPKAVERGLEEYERDLLGHTLTHNTAAGYGAEGYVAGDRVTYNKKNWYLVDFVPFGEKMTAILLDDGYINVAEYVDISKITKVPPVDPKGKKPKGYCGKDQEGAPVDQTPKEKELDLPVSDLKTGENKEQKALNEDKQQRGYRGDKIKMIRINYNQKRDEKVIKNLKKIKGKEGVLYSNYDPDDDFAEVVFSELPDMEYIEILPGEFKVLGSVNEEDGDESKVAGVLVEFINKDPELNKNRFTPIVKNLQRKRREGSYDSNLAAKAFQVLVDEGASKYFNSNDGKLLGSEFSSQNEMFPRDVKVEVTKAFKDQFEANVEMGNLEQEEINHKIAHLVEEAEDALNETMGKEAVPFTQPEMRELKKFDNIDASAENIVTYNWDSGNQSFKVEITKKPRTATNDIVYSAVTTDPEGNIEEDRTKDSDPFKTQEDLAVLRDFLTDLNLNEEGKKESEDDAKPDVHPEQLVMGIKVEMEHTDSIEEAKKVALDHLAEIPDYYTRHSKMEKGAEKSEKKEIKEEKETKKAPKKKKDAPKPSHTTTKMVNALPVKDGKKVRTEVKGDVRVRYKTFEEKRKADKENKTKKKGDK